MCVHSSFFHMLDYNACPFVGRGHSFSHVLNIHQSCILHYMDEFKTNSVTPNHRLLVSAAVGLNRRYSILFYFRLCLSTAGSSPPPDSSIFLCPLLSLSIPLLVAPQCHLSNNVLVFQLISHALSATLCF